MRALTCSLIAAFGLPAAVAFVPPLPAPAGAQENPAEIIAAHIRRQGYACTSALRAERNRRASKPNEAAWTLRCSNATYRVRLVPDMAAHVELVKQDGTR